MATLLRRPLKNPTSPSMNLNLKRSYSMIRPSNALFDDLEKASSYE
jgi:hypothetical protein